MKKTVNLRLTAEHPIMKNHLVHGESVMPGLAYIDMLYQLAKQSLDLSFRSICLKRVTIYHPLSVKRSERLDVSVIFSKEKEFWTASICGADSGTVFLSAEMYEEVFSSDRRLDAGEKKQQAALPSVSLHTVYEDARSRGLSHDGLMKPEGEIYAYEEECFLDIRQSDSCRENLPGALFHPALMDGAAMASGVLQTAAGAELFLPIYYESFIAAETVTERCYAVISKKSGTPSEMVKMDIDFYNPSGVHIASLLGLTAKKVRTDRQLIPGVQQMEETLYRIFSTYVGRPVTRNDAHTVFFELGLESSQLLAIIKDIEGSFDLRLNPTLLFECSSISELLEDIKTKGTDESSGLVADAAPVSETQSGSQTFTFYEHEAFLQDHLVFGKPALMGVVYPCLVLEASGASRSGTYPAELKDIRFTGGPVTLEPGEAAQIDISFAAEKSAERFTASWTVSGKESRKTCAEGEISRYTEAPIKKSYDVEQIKSHAQKVGPDVISRLYDSVADFTIGPMLKTVTAGYKMSESSFLLQLDLSGKKEKGDLHHFAFDPLILNSCYMSLGEEELQLKKRIHVPLMIERLTLYGPVMSDTVYVVNTIKHKKDGFLSFDAAILSHTGEQLAELKNASVKEVLQPNRLENASFAPSGNQSRQETKGKPLDIAVVGISGKYPQADDIDAFWDNLKQGKDCITEIPKDRWKWEHYFSEDRTAPGAIYSKWGGFIDGIADFDPEFFKISPREAEHLDPQERLFLMHAWMAMEDAGYTRTSPELGRQVGVYAGVMYQEYPLFAAEAGVKGRHIGLPGGISSIANRVSYFCDFQGPSMSVDTMCSGSLTSLYMACRDLRDHRIRAALAGGVNLTVHPNKYFMLSQGQFISSKGHCGSFGAGGDGYIPAEGVGVLLLKRLEDAVQDGDRIYGVIKGAAINHGGRASGYTVPNPKAQSEVISQALQEAGVSPGRISYVEAHGTGTKLGDPIEIRALTDAFGDVPETCLVGSVKSNIGHGESAAGIAAVTKVLLQMKHKQIAPSLHADVLNPNIQFDGGPFSVCRELTDWKRISADGEEQPLRAGISSFGAGGSNAHIIIEEYEAPVKQAISSQEPAVILLSAKNGERLTEYAERLLAFLQKKHIDKPDLFDVAYTLQAGREAMDERLALIADSLKELEDKLRSYLENENAPHLYRGRAKRNHETVAVFESDEDLQEAMVKWLKKRKYGHLLKMWVQGVDVDWNLLYSGQKPRRISLPAYPFAKVRCWIQDEAEAVSKRDDGKTVIHPLLHENTSDLWELKFTSVFTGREFFFTDHSVNGQKVLPGAAVIEMARAAVERAAYAVPDGRKGMYLKDLIWMRPVIHKGTDVEVHISLILKENEDIEFTIYSLSEEPGGERILYSKGTAVSGEIAAAPSVHLEGWLSGCSQSVMTSDEVYQAFRHAGMIYGPSHQGIDQLMIGERGAAARLSLPETADSTADQFVIHPSLLDAAFQASLGAGSDTAGDTPMLPFSLRQAEIFQPTQKTMWALVRKQSDRSDNGALTLDIDLCDENGAVCMRLTGFSCRAVRQTNQTESKRQEVQTAMLAPVWDKTFFSLEENRAVDQEQLLIIGKPGNTIKAAAKMWPRAHLAETPDHSSEQTLRELTAGYQDIRHFLWIAPDRFAPASASQEMLDEQENGVIQCFRFIKALLSLGYGNRNISFTAVTRQTQSVYPGDLPQPEHAGVHGLIGSLAKEYPNWDIRLIDAEEGSDSSEMKNIWRLPPDPDGNAAAYRNGAWHKQKTVRVLTSSAPRMSYREGGVYAVIGGAGGIGEAWSKYMITRYKARMIWIGRRPKDQEIQSKIDRLALSGPAPHYIQADAQDAAALKAAVRSIRERYGNITGVIHSAITLADKSMANMDEASFRNAFSAKVNTSVRMIEAFKGEPLDFVLFFSSVNSFTKNAGQSNYAAGCTFQDAFARHIASLLDCEVKVMNWGYWGSLGVVSDPSYRKRMEASGIGSIEPDEAMEALEVLLSEPFSQAAFIKAAPHGLAALTDQDAISVVSGPEPSFMESVKRQNPDRNERLETLKREMELRI
ncbi:SDR family NAD(P)-dependent oxidoreductase [Bacillus sp. YH3-2-B2]